MERALIIIGICYCRRSPSFWCISLSHDDIQQSDSELHSVHTLITRHVSRLMNIYILCCFVYAMMQLAVEVLGRLLPFWTTELKVIIYSIIE